METVSFLRDFVIILAAAIVVIFASSKVRVPTVVGFLLTGLLIGPSGLALVNNPAQVEVFAEIGVVILLFTIGLEFSLERLRQIRRYFFIGGTLQVVSTIALIALVGLAAQFSLPRSLFFGFLVALSSTAIVLKLYTERQEIAAPQGKIVIGILLYQDFLMVVMIILTPVLAGEVAASPGTVAIRFGAGVLAIVAVFVVARKVMPRMLYAIARLRIREVFVLVALVVCLGLALLTEALHFSLALGAFLAGIIISESEYSHQVVSEMAPFRDVFNSMFFISIGMLLNIGFAVEHAPVVLALGAGIVTIKAVIVLCIVLALRFPARVSMIVAVSLAQIGEFSFVLMKIGQSHGLIDSSQYQTFLASSIITMVVTPIAVSAAPRIAEKAQRMIPVRSRTESQDMPPDIGRMRDHVIIVGFGLNGTNLARVLKETGIGHIIIELNGETVKKASAAGESIVYGDATRRDILGLCRIREARVIVFAISDPAASRGGVRLARELQPNIYIVVRTRFVAEIDALYRCGANEVIPEEFETSIEIFTRVLDHYHIARNIINAQEKMLRGERYRVFRSPAPLTDVSEKMMQWLGAGTTEVFLVEEGSRAVNSTLQQLDLRKETGATIIAVVRGEHSTTNPHGTFRIEAGDSLVLVGSHADIDQAFAYLEVPLEDRS